MSTFRSIEAVAEYLAGLAEESPRQLVGIVGSPGSGKSTIAATLGERLESAALLPMDAYHFSQSHLVELGLRDRMGAPDTFDVEPFVAVLSELRGSDHTVVAPSFDRDIEEPVPDAITIHPETRTVVIEGNYLLLNSGGWEHVAQHLGLSFFLQSDGHINRQRLIGRHLRHGKTEAAARAWVIDVDEVNAQVVEATAPWADHLIRLD